MIEQNEPNASDRLVAPGHLSSPRTYFGRASRAATGSLRAAISEPPRPPVRLVTGTRVYRGGDPAMRLFPGLALPYPPAQPLNGAVATLSGLVDGEHERLMIDLGTSLVRSTQRRDPDAGTFSLDLSRTQSAETYRALLGSLRYVNDAAEPSSGSRKVVVQTIDATGISEDVATTTFGVGVMTPEAIPEAPVVEPVTEVAPIAAAEAEPEIAAPPEPPVLDRRVVVGETLTFNNDGDYTLFWWPRLLPPGRVRRPRTVEAAPDLAGVPGSFFTQGGEHYRVFDPAPETAPAAPPVPQRAAANDAATFAAPRPPAEREAPPANDVWTPGSGTPPPGFDRAAMLRLEDIFGSDMDNAVTRRLIEQRVAAGG